MGWTERGRVFRLGFDGPTGFKYEAWGRPFKAWLWTSLPASRAFLCDLLERNWQEIPVREGVIKLALTPFKILTLKLEP